MTHYYWTRPEDHPVTRWGQTPAPSARPRVAEVPPLSEEVTVLGLYHQTEGRWRERLLCDDTALPIPYLLLTRDDVFHTDL